MSKNYTTYQGLDLPNVASRVLESWEKNAIFQKSIETREGNKPFIFFEGPPSANGLPGIHHAMGRSIKDIFCRYKTLKGFQVKRIAGWDTHGLPVELGVEKELGITKEDIGTKITVEEYNEACKKAVMKYTDVWNDRWLKRYATAQIKKQWGENLSKYEGIAMPGGVTFNGSRILDEANQEIEQLEQEMSLSYELPVDIMVG